MLKSFEWYFQPSGSALDEIWKTGILTVDTNVLLDLYRYHESTRDSLISSLQKFEGKKWLSYQACQEFFRNRTKVIISSNQTFKQAIDETEKLTKSLEAVTVQLKGNRIIPTEIADNLKSSVSTAIEKAKSEISSAKKSYPKYLKDDPILEKISSLFRDSIGEGFKQEEIEEINKLAEHRKQNKIPPGYMDNEKDNDRPYGDYYLWRQILDHAKSENLPIIFVTSERKEDWWEQISGITTGPRPELLKEAIEHSGQRVLIYQTERFLECALQRLNQPVNKVAIDEIIAINLNRPELEQAVNLKEHSILESTQSKNAGVLSVELRRAVRNFTVSGRLQPNMYFAPALSVRLMNAPDGIPSFKLGAGTGTTFNFNVHIKSEDDEVFLPPGHYSFEYEATCEIERTEPTHSGSS